MHFVTDELDSDVLVRLLDAVATHSSEAAGHYHLRDYEIAEVFTVLDGRTDVGKAELARLEFAYLAALDRSKRGIPNLERELAANPALFVQALAMIYKRSDGGEDLRNGSRRGCQRKMLAPRPIGCCRLRNVSQEWPMTAR